MKIKFNGMISKKHGGCSRCRKKSKGLGVNSVKTFVLPSGVTRTFRAGRIYEVSTSDGEFLLSYAYGDGTDKTAFSEVS